MSLWTIIALLLFKINIVIGKNNPRLLQHITHNSSQGPLLHVILSLVMFPVCREGKNAPQNYFRKINVPINGTTDAFPVIRKSLKSPILNISKLEDLVERDNMLFYKLQKKSPNCFVPHAVTLERQQQLWQFWLISCSVWNVNPLTVRTAHACNF